MVQQVSTVTLINVRDELLTFLNEVYTSHPSITLSKAQIEVYTGPYGEGDYFWMDLPYGYNQEQYRSFIDGLSNMGHDPRCYATRLPRYVSCRWRIFDHPNGPNINGKFEFSDGSWAHRVGDGWWEGAIWMSRDGGWGYCKEPQS